jgi:hypothetical protein
VRLGINYDTGIFPGTRKSRPVFDPKQVEFDMNTIARDLHCAAVRISGGIPERLAIAAEYAAAAGLEVWFSPFPCELGEDEMLAVFESCAGMAESLRRQSAHKVVLVVGCEVSLFGRGFLPGADAYARIQKLATPTPELFTEYPKIVARLNQFLSNAARFATAKFAGPITYASGPWEEIEWTPFTIVGVDAYRDEANAATLEGQLGALSSNAKPVAVTEFGCCTYQGAGKRGANGWAILQEEGGRQRLKGDFVRDESEQVKYFQESLEIYQRQGIETAFWFTFASWNRPHRQDPREDLDIASFGVVKVADEDAATPAQRWGPKAIFSEFAKAAAKLHA